MKPFLKRNKEYRKQQKLPDYMGKQNNATDKQALFVRPITFMQIDCILAESLEMEGSRSIIVSFVGRAVSVEPRKEPRKEKVTQEVYRGIRATMADGQGAASLYCECELDMFRGNYYAVTARLRTDGQRSHLKCMRHSVVEDYNQVHYHLARVVSY